jgi:hypothetical protein
VAHDIESAAVRTLQVESDRPGEDVGPVKGNARFWHDVISLYKTPFSAPEQMHSNGEPRTTIAATSFCETDYERVARWNRWIHDLHSAWWIVHERRKAVPADSAREY